MPSYWIKDNQASCVRAQLVLFNVAASAGVVAAGFGFFIILAQPGLGTPPSVLLIVAFAGALGLWFGWFSSRGWRMHPVRLDVDSVGIRLLGAGGELRWSRNWSESEWKFWLTDYGENRYNRRLARVPAILTTAPGVRATFVGISRDALVGITNQASASRLTVYRTVSDSGTILTRISP